MKFLVKRSFAVVLAVILLSACGEGDKKDLGSTLTPEENKVKLEQCAMNVLGKINPQVHQELITTIEAFAYKADYGLSLDLKGKMSVVDVVRKTVTTCNPVLLSEMATNSNYMTIPSGVYVFNESKEAWEMTPSADILQFVFDVNGNKSSISVKWSGEELPVQVDGSSEGVLVPEHVELLIDKGTSNLATLTINTTTVDIETLTLDCDVSLKTSGDYSWLVDVAVSPAGISTAATMNIASSNIVGTYLNLQLNANDVNLGMDDEDFVNAILSASTTTIINSEVMLTGNISKVKEMVSKIHQINAATEKEHYTEEASIINQYMDAGLFYVGDKEPFASIETQAYEYNYGNTHVEYYDVEPVLVFASDESRYSFDEFFNEYDFANVVRNFQILLGQYVSMVR